ncbi:MAG: DUF2786 domain-containing protein [Rhodospirillaceae bacterium]
MSVADFSAKDRLRFRKLLEVAYSTTFPGERDAALNAARKLAATHGMSLHEAAGMKEPAAPEPKPQPRPRGHAGFAADFGAAGPENMGRWWARYNARGRGTDADHAATTESARVAAEKKRRDEAMEDAFRRGLDAEEIKARAKAEARAANRDGRPTRRPGNRGPWRSRPEFIRVLLTETQMTAKDIAAVAGVTIYDVFREKLLLRRAAAA